MKVLQGFIDWWALIEVDALTDMSSPEKQFLRRTCMQCDGAIEVSVRILFRFDLHKQFASMS